MTLTYLLAFVFGAATGAFLVAIVAPADASSLAVCLGVGCLFVGVAVLVFGLMLEWWVRREIRQAIIDAREGPSGVTRP